MKGEFDMDIKEFILSRRSIRKFKEFKVEKEKIDLLLEAACSAPSACNKKPYQLYIITDETKLGLLNKCGRFTNISSPLKIVVCGDMKKALPKSMADYWIQDASAVVENILLMANGIGLGTCWCGVYLQERVMTNVKEILNLEDDLIPFALINIGYPDEIKEPHAGYDKSIIHYL